MTKIEYETHNADETIAIGKQIAEYLEPGMIIRLEGELGAGKTTITSGIAQGFGITRYIKSPTYTIIREYTEGVIPLYHVDLYRLDENSAEEIGLDDYLYGDGVTVIEWGSVAEDSMPEEYLSITFEKPSEDLLSRKLVVQATGDKYNHLITDLSEQNNEP